MVIFYDPGTRNRLELAEERPNGMALYRDLDAKVPTLIICHKNAVDYQPRTERPFQPVRFLNEQTI